LALHGLSWQLKHRCDRLLEQLLFGLEISKHAQGSTSKLDGVIVNAQIILWRTWNWVKKRECIFWHCGAPANGNEGF